MTVRTIGANPLQGVAITVIVVALYQVAFMAIARWPAQSSAGAFSTVMLFAGNWLPIIITGALFYWLSGRFIASRWQRYVAMVAVVYVVPFVASMLMGFIWFRVIGQVR
jgi:hypothetical protein